MRSKEKRKTKGPGRLQLRDAKGMLIFDDRTDRMAVDEKHIIHLSIYFFNDPAPCFIHRGAVLSRVFGELEEVLGNEWMEIGKLDEMIRKHLSMYEVREIRILREES